MLRLLYRLLIQRIHENQEMRRVRSLDTSGAVLSKAVFDGPKRNIAIAILLAVITILYLGYRFNVDLPVPNPDTEMANLEIIVKSIQNHPVVIYLDIERYSAPMDTQTAPSDVTKIIIENNQFKPTFQLASAGSTVEFVNQDEILHNAHVIDGNDTVFNVATPLQRIAVRKTLTATGMLEVRCDLHPQMRSWLFVPTNSHYAIVNKKASRLFWKNIEPGKYNIRVWKAGEHIHQQPVHLKAREKRSVVIL